MVPQAGRGLTSGRTLKERIVPERATRVVRPKGRVEITEADVMSAGKDAALAEYKKVVSFSAMLTAKKLVIRVEDRRRS